MREGRLDAADEVSKTLLRTSPRDPAAHQLAATIALRRGHFGEAKSSARECLKLRRDHIPALSIAGQAARQLGDMPGAIQWFRRLCEASPDTPEPLFQLCALQIETADPVGDATMAKLVQRFPRHANGWREVGSALMRAKRFADSEAAFRRAANESEDPGCRVNLGCAILAQGRPADAIAPLRQALAAAPHLVEALLPLAQALRQTGAPREALKHLQRLAEGQPNNGAVFFALGLVCDDLRDRQGAVAAYRHCIAVQPNIPEAHVNLGAALQQIGEFDEAMQCYRQAMRLRPDTFGRIAQALPSTQRGALWLDLRKLRRSLIA